MKPVWFFHFDKLWQILLLKVLACTSLILRVSTVSFPNTLTMGSPVCCLCSIWLYNQIWACYLNPLMPAMIKKVLPRISPFFLSFLLFTFGAICSLLVLVELLSIKKLISLLSLTGFWQFNFFFLQKILAKADYRFLLF